MALCKHNWCICISKYEHSGPSLPGRMFTVSLSLCLSVCPGSLLRVWWGRQEARPQPAHQSERRLPGGRRRQHHRLLHQHLQKPEWVFSIWAPGKADGLYQFQIWKLSCCDTKEGTIQQRLQRVKVTLNESNRHERDVRSKRLIVDEQYLPASLPASLDWKILPQTLWFLLCFSSDLRHGSFLCHLSDMPDKSCPAESAACLITSEGSFNMGSPSNQLELLSNDRYH